MSESIKQRFSGSHIGKMNDKELRKLLSATLTDLTSLRTAVNTIAADHANLQIVTNNLVALTVALKVQGNALVTDVQGVSNNTNAANNTYQVTATAVTNNVSAVTLGEVSAVSALTLVA